MSTLALPKSDRLPAFENDLERLNRFHWQATLSLVSYGVRIGIRVSDPGILEQIHAYLPPGWKTTASPVVDELYSVIISKTSNHQLYRRQEQLIQTNEPEDLLEALDSDLRLQIATSVKDQLFVHAGVVGWHGRAIVIPGRSFSGKTTLVAALIKAGATYYSDEYAVFDSEGFVHPYPRRLSIRQDIGQRTKRYSAAELGGSISKEPLPVGMVVHAQYESGTQWHPAKMSPGQAVLALLDNTVVARLRPEFALAILSRAVTHSCNLTGKRGEAELVVRKLLVQLETSFG